MEPWVRCAPGAHRTHGESAGPRPDPFEIDEKAQHMDKARNTDSAAEPYGNTLLPALTP